MDHSDVGGVDEELSEARQLRIRSGSELAGSGLESSGEVGEVEREAVGVALPLVLPAVEDHEPGAWVDQQREAGVVGQRRCCGRQVTLLRRRGGAVARDRAEHRLPVGCLDSLAERVARYQVDPDEIVRAVQRGDADAVRVALAEDFVFATDRHEAIAKALGLPRAAVGWGYRYLSQDAHLDHGPTLIRI